MTEDEVWYAASQAVTKLEPDSVVLSVGRLPDKPFGWVVVFEGGKGGRRSVTFEHRAEEPPGALRGKIEDALREGGGPGGEPPSGFDSSTVMGD